MGGDGQALTNKRSLLLKSKAFATAAQLEEDGLKEKQTKKSRSVERWRHCALSLWPLEFPVAFDMKGDVFSKQSIVDYLIRRKERAASGESDEPEVLHIKRLGDVREVSNETDDPDRICCPVTGFVASSGMHTFVGFWSCGHIICSSVLPKWTDLSSQVDVECPFCGERSFYVRLILDDDTDAATQCEFLRAHVKGHRKRGRGE